MVQGISPALSVLANIGKRIRNVSNNIANVSTQGFKKSRSTASSLPPSTVNTSSGSAQIGQGSALETLSQQYQQGSFEPVQSSTGMAIGGQGFFIVKDSQGQDYYTREGNFTFDNQGRLTNSQGYVVQGWAIDPNSGRPVGSLTDITMQSFVSSPQETTVIKNIVNLDADASNRVVGQNALADAWDGDNGSRPISELNYGFQATTKIHDQIGAEHDITIYFDKSDQDGIWEYIVTTNPLEDKRINAAGRDLGLLARGTIEFNASGDMSNMTMDINDGAGNWETQDPSAVVATGGHFSVQPDFQGASDTTGGGSTQMAIQIDFGARFNGTAWEIMEPSTTQYSSSSHTISSSADGYGAGDLNSVSVSPDGIISGSYSNGNVTDLYQVGMAKFQNQDGLAQAGNNLYTSTRNAGSVINGSPGSGGLGKIVPNALEQSNVDLAEEFAKLILYQRSFEANLKAIEMDNELKGNVLDILS